jgi:hypothetical protein
MGLGEMPTFTRSEVCVTTDKVLPPLVATCVAGLTGFGALSVLDGVQTRSKSDAAFGLDEALLSEDPWSVLR